MQDIIKGQGNIDFFPFKMSEQFTNYGIIYFKKLYGIKNGFNTKEEKIDFLNHVWFVKKPISSPDNYLFMQDSDDPFLTIKNGFRLYKGFDDTKEKKIYIFGGSRTLGIGNDNEHTCSYYLSKLIPDACIYNSSCIDESLINVYYRIINTDINDSIIILNLNINIVQYYLDGCNKILDLLNLDESNDKIQNLFYSYLKKLLEYCSLRNNKLLIFCENYCQEKPNIMRLVGDTWKDQEFHNKLKLINKIENINLIELPDECFLDFTHTNGNGQKLVAEHLKGLIDKKAFLSNNDIPDIETDLKVFYKIQELHSTSIFNSWKTLDSTQTKIEKYTEYLKSLTDSKIHKSSQKRGLIMMTCNPFTKGHLHILESLLSKVDILYVHVGDGEFYFPFDVRFNMVKEATSKNENIIILEPSEKLLSSKTIFYNYLYKEELNNLNDVRELIDFEKYAQFMYQLLIKNLDITHLCWGQEDSDKITDCYNNDMLNYIKDKINYIILDRIDGVSGTKCRKYFDSGNFKDLSEHMDERSIDVLKQYYKKIKI